MEIHKTILQVIGNTPMMDLSELTDIPKVKILAKIEYLNPSGSIKDRIAKYMIEKAEEKGLLKPGYSIVEATSGNTGIAFSFVSTVKKYQMFVCLPETMSAERPKIMKQYGANVILTPGDEFIEGCVRKAKEMARKPKFWMPSQFTNMDNVAAHRETTGKEILIQTGGKVDAFVAGVGTGGTLMGVAEALRERNSNVKIFGVEPEGGGITTSTKPHRIEGIGDGFIPEIVDMSKVNEWIVISDEDAIRMAKHLAKEYGLFVGISSGGNIFASLQVAKRLGKEKTIVTVLPDSADRYYSTDLF